MDLILVKAKKFADNFFSNGVSEYQRLIEAGTREFESFDEPLDRIKYINFLLERNNSDYEKHKLVCKNPEDCHLNFSYENIRYYFRQELNRLGVHLNDDAFTQEEKENAETKLDKILVDLSEIKLGQQVIYEDLTKEINELRDLYFLGKKKWYQLLIGKSLDMVTSGIVSETISKEIIEEIKKNVPALQG